MTNPNRIMLAVTGILSLAIGVLIGQGVKVNALSGTAVDNPESVAAPNSLEQMMMMVFFKQAQTCQDEIRVRMDDMQAANATANNLCVIRNELSNLKPGDSLMLSEETYKSLTASGIACGEFGVPLTLAQVTVIIDSIEGVVSSLTSLNQMEMIELQCLISNAENAMTMASNMAKTFQSRPSAIIGNLR